MSDQIIIFLCAIAVILLALFLIKKLFFKLLTIGIICTIAIYSFAVKMPDHINKDNITSVVSQYTPSDSVKFDSDSIQVKLADTWVDVKDIQSVVKDKDGVMKVMVQGQGIAVEDKTVKAVIDALTQK